jgi:HEPN domain-containing protein
MDKKEAAKEWFDIADKDLALAGHALGTMHPAPYELICYHCQQSAEKNLKGYIVFHGVVPPKVHDLPELQKLSEALNTKIFSNNYKAEYRPSFTMTRMGKASSSNGGTSPIPGWTDAPLLFDRQFQGKPKQNTNFHKINDFIDKLIFL